MGLGRWSLALVSVVSAVALVGCDRGPDLPAYGRPTVEGYRQLATGTYFNGRTDQRYWIFVGDAPLPATLQSVGIRLTSNNWNVGLALTREAPTILIANREGACFQYGDLRAELPGYIEPLTDGHKSELAKLAEQSQIYVVGGC